MRRQCIVPMVTDAFFEEFLELEMYMDRAKYDMRKLGRITGGVTRINLTIPTYLLVNIDAWSASRSLFVTFMVEDYLARNEILPPKCPRLNILYRYMKATDRFAKKVKLAGGRNLETDRTMRAYRTYMRRFTRAIRRQMKEMLGVATAAKKIRAVIPAPKQRLRPDLVRRTDAESKQDMGAEYYIDKEDEKNEMYRTNPDKFKSIWPDEFIERKRQDGQQAEDDRQDPTPQEEDGDDPPEL